MDALVVKNLLAMQEMQETQVESLGQEDPLEEENGNPLQYSFLGNSVYRGALGPTARGVAKLMTELSSPGTHRVLGGFGKGSPIKF